MIDNIEIIKPLLSWDSEDDFYFVQVLKRKKENPEIGSNSHVCKTYYIRSIENLEREYGEMKCLATYHNARVCINLNKRSFERTSYHTLKKITDQILNKDFKQARKAYNSVCGMYAGDDDRNWIIDIDDNQIDENKFLAVLKGIRPVSDKFIVKIPTKNGYHLITKPFDIKQFNQHHLPKFDIHKNNPTNLFIP